MRDPVLCYHHSGPVEATSRNAKEKVFMKNSASSIIFPRENGRKVTLRSMAAELGVSQVTVMRALSGHPNVRPEVREKIVGLASKLGYRLPGRRTGNVAVVVKADFPGYLALLLEKLCMELSLQGLHAVILPEPDIDCLGDVMFDGIISTTWAPGFERKYPKNHALPLVSLNTMDNRMDNVYMVSSDESGGITLGLRYLYDAGCRRIFFPRPEAIAGNMCSVEREAAYRKFCLERGLDGEGLVVPISGDPELLSRVIGDVLDSGIDGIFVPSEKFALPVLKALRELGVKIPEQISVMGLECDFASGFLSPALTTIRQDYEGLARESVAMLKKLMDGKPVTASVRLPYRLIERESVRKSR